MELISHCQRYIRPALVAMLLVILGIGQIRAAINGSQPEISLAIEGPPGYPVNGAVAFPGNQITVQVEVGIPGSLLLEGDLYVGILPHKSDSSWTWTTTNDRVALTTGMVPIIEDIDMSVVQSIRPSAVVNSFLRHTFTGDEQPGLYFVFVMLVVANADPGNNQNWLGVRMVPFMVNPRQ